MSGHLTSAGCTLITGAGILGPAPIIRLARYGFTLVHTTLHFTPGRAKNADFHFLLWRIVLNFTPVLNRLEPILASAMPAKSAIANTKAIKIDRYLLIDLPPCGPSPWPNSSVRRVQYPARNPIKLGWHSVKARYQRLEVISNRLNSPVAGSHVMLTPSTRLALGPCFNATRKASNAPSSPSATTSTSPFSLLRTKPVRRRSLARSNTKYRKPTP